MPSGITSKIYDGQEVSLRDYLNSVARSMTMTIMQREDPIDEPVRLREENSYEHKRLEEAKAKVQELEDMTQAEVEAAAKAAYKANHKRWRESKARRAQLRARYENMLAQVYEWECPEVIAYIKEYAIKYLKESIEFDCHDDTFEEKYNPEPQREDPAVWYARQKESAAVALSRATESLAEEKQRCAEFNVQIRAFLDALPED